ncbi:hypothetical protein CC85DRAFT_301114 [Cutaneotrichosporon oleaginosum]|uniref:Uncharacterized protein n=1 Tax=Cutaneotrichosporon oleaginosum TaxID=879819 RepID=A0A0J0XRJ6_9TREE|nr:uncharacterized protein CC85DRAFT_301114 [Cutaneotrichosporon oleaginosum]KLT43715.1 hypothetical protein CC85DRAFT_301114 [Cutaneotrichosporon oleaginosum]TXT05133.1 hypothetical protein COLE_06453 [Cutaneotrichosporon oleaginosum]
MPGFNHIRVRKSYSRDTLMVSPVDENGVADRWADASNPHVVSAVATATIVDDECNGSLPSSHVAALGLADALRHVHILRRGPETSGGPEPRPALPGRVATHTMVRFIDLTAWNSDDAETFWRTRPIMGLLARPKGATRMVLNSSFDPRHPRLREASFSAYFLGLSEVTLIFTPYERVRSPPPSGDLMPMSAANTPTGTPTTSPRTSTDKPTRPGFITSNIPPEQRWLGMLNDLMYALSECFGGTTCRFTLVGVETIPAAALNLDPALADDWPSRRETVRKLIGRQVNFTRGVYPPQPPIPADELAHLLQDIRILTREEYRQRVGAEEFELFTMW